MASRFPTKSLRIRRNKNAEWEQGKMTNGGWFEFHAGGTPFAFPIDVEATSVYDEVLTDALKSVEVIHLCDVSSPTQYLFWLTSSTG